MPGKVDDASWGYADGNYTYFFQVRNGGPAPWGPGALRFFGVSDDGERLPYTIPHGWVVASGETAQLSCMPVRRSGRHARFEEFAWVDWSGAVHPITGHVVIGAISVQIEG